MERKWGLISYGPLRQQHGHGHILLKEPTDASKIKSPGMYMTNMVE